MTRNLVAGALGLTVIALLGSTAWGSAPDLAAGIDVAPTTDHDTPPVPALPVVGHPQWPCVGAAPEVPTCTTGTHTWNGGVLSHGFGYTTPAGSVNMNQQFSGTAQSTLSHANGARVFRCNYNAGALISCAGSGTFPPVGAQFTHDCAALNLGTTTPGGSGLWGCRVQHG